VAVLPMFPLGTVLLPSAVIPLHVFEPRYRALVHDCLAADREFGIVLIARGSEVGGDDERTDAGTVARIVEAVEMPDGRWAIGAVGARRLRVLAWLPDDPYPRAEVADWPDVDPGPGHGTSLEHTIALLRRVLALATEAGDQSAPATIALSEDPVLAGYHAAAVAPIGPHDRQRLLTAASPDERLVLLDEMLEECVEVLRLRLAEG
jgi:Lon protease-like protein